MEIVDSFSSINTFKYNFDICICRHFKKHYHEKSRHRNLR